METRQRCRLAAPIACALTLIWLSPRPAGAVMLGGTDVPRDKIVVFLFIGHSNVQGATEDPDLVAHPRVWNYQLPDAVATTTGWVPATDPLHRVVVGTGTSGGPAMVMMKSLASRYPGYHIGAVQNHHWSSSVRADDGTNNRYWKPGGDNLYKEIVDAANSIKADVTLGGIVAMIGFVAAADPVYAATFSDDVTQMVNDMRADLGQPDLPFLIDREYESAPRRDVYLSEWQTTQAERLLIPTKLPRSVVVDVDGPYRSIDGIHFNGAGMQAWGSFAADMMARNGWFPETDPPTIAAVNAAGDPNRVTVVFSEYVDQSTAQALSSYAVDNSVNVSTAVLGADGKTITLTTSTLSPGTTYTLTVTGVEDTPGNVIASGSTATFIYVAEVLSGRMAHWRFDENAGTTAADSSGSGHDGLLVGLPAWIAPGRVGTAALELDGSDRIEVADFAPPVDITLSAWIYPTGVNGVLMQKQGEYDFRVLPVSSAGDLWVSIAGGTAVDSSMDLFDPANIDRWHHVAATFDDAADTIKLFIDGAEVAWAVAPGSLTDQPGPLWIGRHTGDFLTFEGRIDDVRIYDRPLDGGEIASLAATAPPDSTPPSLVIASPTDGAFVSRTIMVAGTASDDVAVAQVEVQVDTGVLGLATGTTDWTYALDTTGLADGSHTIMVWATDTAANLASEVISITVDNSGPPDTTDPIVAITSPLDGTTVYGGFVVTGTTSDDVAVFQVEVAVDNGAYAMAVGTTSWYYTVGATALTIGSHTITALTTDSSGNTATDSISLTVGQPSITILSPSGGEVWPVGSTQRIEWTTEILTDVGIFYSPDDGATWSSITNSVSDANPSWASYPWVVPDELSTQCRIRIQGYFGESPTDSGTFEIAAAAGLDPEGPPSPPPAGTKVRSVGCSCRTHASQPAVFMALAAVWLGFRSGRRTKRRDMM